MAAASDYEATFRIIDTDGDGLITAVEFKALMQHFGQTLSDEAAATMLGFIDTNGDGKVTQEELQAYPEKA